MKIELRKYTEKDKDGLITLCNQADRTYLSGRLPLPYTESDADWWIHMVSERDGKYGLYRMIFADGKPVGNISVEKKSDVFEKDADLGYMIFTEQWSKGITTEAVRQICKLAFSKLDIIRISGSVFEPNTASRRVLEKNGFQQEGIIRKAAVKEGNVYDMCLYGLLKE